MSDEVSSFTIKELTGDKRSLRLAGRALPYKPLTLEGKQRVEITRYPGNPVASAQMLGADEAPTTVTGKWKDRFIKNVTPDGNAVTPSGVAEWNGEQVRDVRALVNAVDQLRLAGQMIELTWNEIVRTGILVRFKQSWDRNEDVEFEMEFEWLSRGEPESPITVAVLPATDSLAAKMNSLYDSLESAITESTAYKKADAVTKKLTGFLDEMNDAIEAVRDIADKAADLVLTPVTAATSAVAALNRIKATSVSILDALRETSLDDFIGDLSAEGDELTAPPGFVNYSNTAATAKAPVAERYTDLGPLLEASLYREGVRGAAKDLQRTAAEQSDYFQGFIDEDDLLATFVARENSDLRDVAQQYYGDHEEWRRLLAYNRFRSSRLVAGDVVLVPKVTTEDRGV